MTPGRELGDQNLDNVLMRRLLIGHQSGELLNFPLKIVNTMLSHLSTLGRLDGAVLGCRELCMEQLDDFLHGREHDRDTGPWIDLLIGPRVGLSIDRRIGTPDRPWIDPPSTRGRG